MSIPEIKEYVREELSEFVDFRRKNLTIDLKELSSAVCDILKHLSDQGVVIYQDNSSVPVNGVELVTNEHGVIFINFY